MENPLVSIIMNCYNSDEFLREAIDSVFAQTYQNWEIIFWDNKSNDKSAEIAQTYDRRLRYFKSKEHTTLYTARNFALKKCSGDYIAFLDCDDIWVETKLDKQIKLALSGYDVIYGGYDTINSEGATISNEVKYLVSGKITNALFRRNSISIGTIVIKSSILQDEQFDPFYDLLGDYDLWVRLSKFNVIVAVPCVVEHCRRHDNNITVTMNNKWLSERRHFYRKHLSIKKIFQHPWITYYILKSELLGLAKR
jgi:glycosyltransferase involved in cell wall biosynthesis